MPHRRAATAPETAMRYRHDPQGSHLTIRVDATPTLRAEAFGA